VRTAVVDQFRYVMKKKLAFYHRLWVMKPITWEYRTK